jgi:hypothetical protein
MAPKLDKAEKFEKKHRSWEKMRKRGRQSIALLYGSLGWGGFMILFMNCARVFLDHKRLDWTYVMIGGLIFPLAGYFWGLWMWRWCEEHFHGPTNKPPSIIAN